jgi:protein TorT
MSALSRLVSALLLVALMFPAEVARTEETWALEARSVAFDDASIGLPLAYHPLERASRPWRLCILYPHLKDAYWLSVNYGMVREAERLGVSFELFEAGGYPNLRRQKEQLAACGARDFDAVILGTVSFEGLTPTVEEVARRKPVIATVNDIDDRGISAKASVPWREMGHAAGRAIADRHPKGSAPVRVAWFPGPKGAGWVRFVEQGFYEAIAQSSAKVVAVRFGDTGVEQQVLLVEDVLDTVTDLDYLVGSGPMAESAISLLRARDLSDRIGVVSTYMSHGVYRGIKRGRVLAAPTDFPVRQGALSIEMAVRALEGRLEIPHAGPQTVTIWRGNINLIGPTESLAPANFNAVFALEDRSK